MHASDPAEPLLRWLQATIVTSVRRRDDDLTMRQLAVLMIIYLEDEGQTVRGLANALRISRPAISRALDRLCEAGLTRRQVDSRDRRSVVVRRTRKGSERLRILRALMLESLGPLADVVEKVNPGMPRSGSLAAAAPTSPTGEITSNTGSSRL